MCGVKDLLVALLVEFGRNEVLQLAPNDAALGFPQGKSLAHHLVEVKEAHFAAQLTVVALLGFLEAA